MTALGRELPALESGNMVGASGQVSEFALPVHPDYAVAASNRSGQLVQRACRAVCGSAAAHLRQGDEIVTAAIEITTEHILQLVASSPSRGTRANVVIEFCILGDDESQQSASWAQLASWQCGHESVANTPAPSTAQFSLAELAGQRVALRVRCEGMGLYVMQFVVCPAHRIPLLHARSSYAFRMQNELQNFSSESYTHAMYGNQSEAAEPVNARDVNEAAEAKPLRALRDEAIKRLTQRAQAHLDNMQPDAGELAFGYALRALAALLPMSPPDFAQRTTALSADKPLRMLSLCAGAARVEEQLLANCASPVHLTLLDASRELAERAAARLSQCAAGQTVECLVGDINAGLPGDGSYDVIMCVSALHHVVDLEAVLEQCNERLIDGGEFWSIGEQIGRNGNRLWPEAYVAANQAFSQLPRRLRANKKTGKINEQISDADFSTGCFEGIRSEELEGLLEAYFVPLHVYKRNAFLWRLVDLECADNYDLTNQEDVHHLHQLVIAEAVHWAMGGRSTELHGVYQKKALVPVVGC